jgi:hypothetical protein
MTDKDSTPPQPPLKKTSRGLVLPANCRETTREHAGSVTAVVGAPRQPLDFGPNSRDVTAEHVGTIIAIVGAPKPPKDKPK